MSKSFIKKAFNILMLSVGVSLTPNYGQTISQSTVEKTNNFLDIKGAKIYYEDEGTGEAIVFLHDGLVHSVCWDGVWDDLRGKFRVVRYDRRGYGRSSLPHEGFIQPDDLQTLLNHLGIEHATIVGASSGGAIAIDFSIRHPKMVDRLILIGSTLHGMVVTSSFNERGNKNNAPLEKGDVAAAAKNWADDTYTIRSQHTVAKKNLFETLVNNPQNLKYTGEFEIRFLRPAVLRLSEVHAPTLLLIGEFDIPDVHAFGGVIQAGIAGARRELVKGSAHAVPIEDPDYLVRRITKFIGDYPLSFVPLGNLESFQGKYKLWGQAATFVLKDGHLIAQIPAEWDIPLFAVSESKFRCFMWSQDAELEFIKDEKGKVVECVITNEDGSIIKCQRL